MRHVWRWFGPIDRVTLADARQAGAQGIVTALHHVPYGAVWTEEEIRRRQREVETLPGGSPSGLRWEVVESLPVSEEIKTRTGDFEKHIEAYKASLAHLSACGLTTICYNFMPVLDWTRTDLAFRVPHGGTTMRFDIVDFALFDIHVLRRAGAEADYAPQIVDECTRRRTILDAVGREQLARNVNAGLPGATEDFSLESLRAGLARYRELSEADLRAHLVAFLRAVAPVAEELGLRLCCHPDDPPFPLLGLPRIMSTAAHYREVLAAVDSPASGMTLCTGSFGARGDNDLPAIVREFGPKIHFAHLRNVRRESELLPNSFHEDEHLDGHTDMVAVVEALLAEERRRQTEGRADAAIPMRPDHGQDILTDAERGAQPGYPAIGRLKGLAELRGVERALSRALR